MPLSYTIRGQLERIGNPASVAYPFSARYSYHPNAAVDTAEFRSAGTPASAKRYRYVYDSSSYDALTRLKSADYSYWSGGWATSAAHDLTGTTYDASGNLKTLQRRRGDGSLVDHLSYSYPSTSNRLGSVSDAVSTTTESWDAEDGGFTYDANGNLKTAPAPYAVTAVTYDHNNLPLSLTSGGVSTTYRYDHAGQRITKRVGTGATEVYLLEGATPLAVFTVDAAGLPTAWHFNVIAGERVVGRAPHTGGRRYYHTDLLGSTRAVVEASTVHESYDYDPWGVLMPGRTLAGDTKEGFTGKERDAESGLDYFGFRYYMAALGRWSNVDPLADDFPSWSPYNYTLNNPLALVDANGMAPKVPIEPNRRQAGTANQVVERIRSHFGDRAVTLQGLRYTQENQGGGRQVGPFGGGNGLRYVYTTNRGWIDLAHFFQAAAAAQTEIGGGIKKFAAKTVARTLVNSKLWEATVQVEDAQSGETHWSYEDAPSNKAGLDFFLDYYESDDDLIDAFTRFLQDAGAVDPRQAPNWDLMQPEPQRDRWFLENRSFDPVLHPTRVDSRNGQRGG